MGDSWIATAAHCTQSGVYQVVFGEHSLSTVDGCEKTCRVVQIVDHFAYDPSTLENDYSLLRVDCVAGYPPIHRVDDAALSFNVPETMLTTSGWGLTSESASSVNDVPMQVDVPVVSNEDCNENYHGTVKDTMMCAGYVEDGQRDACSGDSGGPLFAIDEVGRYYLVGVVSWGAGCARVGYPGVYATASLFREWTCAHTGVPAACYTSSPASPPRPPASPSPQSAPPSPPPFYTLDACFAPPSGNNLTLGTELLTTTDRVAAFDSCVAGDACVAVNEYLRNGAEPSYYVLVGMSTGYQAAPLTFTYLRKEACAYFMIPPSPPTPPNAPPPLVSSCFKSYTNSYPANAQPLASYRITELSVALEACLGHPDCDVVSYQLFFNQVGLHRGFEHTYAFLPIRIHLLRRPLRGLESKKRVFCGLSNLPQS